MTRDTQAWVAWAALVTWLALVTVWAWPLGAYSPDSWMYLDMAQHIQEGQPFRADTVRQFQSSPGVAISFPIGYPLVLAIAEFLLPVEARIGLVVNVLLMLATSALLHRRLRPYGMAAVGPVAVLAMTLFFPFTRELAAARSMPLAVIALVGFLLTIDRLTTRRHWAMAGLLAGAGGLVRFDLMPIMAGTLLLCWLAMRTVGQRDSASPSLWDVATGIATAVVVPIAVAMLATLIVGEAVASDNSRTILAAAPTYVRDYLPGHVPTVVDAPGAWMRRVAGNHSVALGSLREVWKALAPVGALLLVGRATGRARPRLAAAAFAAAVVGAVAVAGSILATSYDDPRYWSPVVLAAVVAVLAAPALPSLPLPPRLAALVLTLVLVWRMPPVDGLGQAWAARGVDPLAVPAVAGLDTSCLGDLDRVMLLGTGAATRLAVTEDVLTSAVPSNLAALDESAQRQFVREFGVTHVHAVEDMLEQLEIHTVPTRCRGLREIASTRDDSL